METTATMSSNNTVSCKLILSNNETIYEDVNNVGWWRHTLQYIKSNKLKVKAFFVDGQQWDGTADGFFMLFSMSANSGGQSSSAKGYGWYKRSINKARIVWYGDNGEKMAEVRRPADAFINDIIAERLT